MDDNSDNDVTMCIIMFMIIVIIIIISMSISHNDYNARGGQADPAAERRGPARP